MDRLRLLELKPSPAGFFRGWYERDIAALFTEADRYFEAGEDDKRNSYGYQTTARQMRERRQARGFSAQRAWSGLASARQGAEDLVQVLGVRCMRRQRAHIPLDDRAGHHPRSG